METDLKTKIVGTFVVAALVFSLMALALNFAQDLDNPPQIQLNDSEASLPPLGHPIPDSDYLTWVAADAVTYQVDVFVTSSHATDHATANAAMRCLSKNGNVATFSEAQSRALHVLCWDNKAKVLYDVIMTRINKFVQRYENFYSYLKTAYAPFMESEPAAAIADAVQSGDKLAQVNYYLAHLEETVGGKVVQLFFDPMEIMFIPK